MCGIAGIYSYRDSAPPVDREELLRIREAMVKRGPDGAGLWISSDQRIGLAHRRLAIIDLSEAGAQPMASADGRLCISFNGEIYNYQELRKELQRKGYEFHSNSDTEVLLHLYADRGADMVHALRGMFAFAIWDNVQKGVFLARDPFGIKPFYYADDTRCLRFASQVKALLRGGAIKSHPEAAAYAGFFIWGYVPEPFTLHREIRMLPAGTHMWCDRNGTRKPVQFFNVREQYAQAEANVEATTSVAQVIDALRDSVSHHMIADVPLSIFLSAGLDSTVVAALASRSRNQKLKALTLGFNEYRGGQSDETELAALAANRIGVGHEAHWATRRDFDDDLEDILESMDQPTTDGVNTYLVSKAAAKSGMRVALSGLGADEMMSGYPSFRDVPRIRRYSSATGLPPLFGRYLRQIASPMMKQFTSPKFAGLLEYGQTYAGAYLLRRSLYMPWELPQVMDADFAAKGWEDLQCLPGLQSSHQGLRNEMAIVSALELDWYMRNQLLRDSDWAGMAHSIEIRLPYVDTGFFQATLTAMAAGINLQKLDLANRIEPALPAEILSREKSGFLAPVREWCGSNVGTGVDERGLRGWARIVIRDSLAATGANASTAKSGFVSGFAISDSKSPQNVTTLRSEFNTHRTTAQQMYRRAQASLVEIAYWMTNRALQTAALVLWPNSLPTNPKRICIYRIGNIGDIVCALPAMASIRAAYPDAHITVLTSPGSEAMPGAKEILAGSAVMNDLWIYYTEEIDTLSKKLAMIRSVRARGFDMWIDLPNNLTSTSRQFRDMFFARLGGVGWAGGWRIDTLKFAAQAQSEYLHFPNEVERILDVVRDVGILVGDVDFPLARQAIATYRIDALIAENDLASAHLIAIAPGAKRSTNLWMPERFAEVGRQLIQSGRRVILIGGKHEVEMCSSMAREIGAKAVSVAGQLSLLESCELLRRCDLAICVDSGVQHLASAVATPCVSLFSFWQMRGKWHPYGKQNVVLQKWVPCHTCLLETCPNKNQCMKAISVDEVVANALHFLTPPPPAKLH